MAVERNDDFAFELIDGGEISIDGSVVPTPYPITEAVKVGEVVVVLYDPDADPRRYGTFRNVVALDRGGRQVWVAETPTTSTGDCYYHIASAKPLIAYPTQSFDCTIDPTSGRITEQVFTK